MIFIKWVELYPLNCSSSFQSMEADSPTDNEHCVMPGHTHMASCQEYITLYIAL